MWFTDEKTGYWLPMMKGKPTHAWYFWKGAFSLFVALFALAQAGWKIRNQPNGTAIALVLLLLFFGVLIATRSAFDLVKKVRGVQDKLDASAWELVNHTTYSFFYMYMFANIMVAVAALFVFALS